MTSSNTKRLPVRLAALVAFASVLAMSAPAFAHFTLDEPASWMSQDAEGAPEKQPPCGNEGGGTPTHMITAYKQGDTITITIDEKIFHPGHYRISLATKADRSDFPPEPLVTKGSDSPCGTAAVMDPPVFPVLADNQLIHTQPFTSPQTIHVKVPSGVTCDHCTLQVLEFMSHHPLNVPGGCFYHHCADISIAEVEVTDGGAAGGGSTDGSGGDGTVITTETSNENGGSTSSSQSSDGGAGGSGGAGSSSSGCGCSTPGSGASALAGLAGFALVFAFARRRRATRRRLV
jgi:MYXO-CTERM domain-containing protein